MEINHKIDNKVDRVKEQDKSIQRVKKPRTQAQIDATKKMLEGRKKWAENKGKENKAKKVAKLKEKIAKIDPTENEEVIEGCDLSNSPTLSTQNVLEENLSSDSVIYNPPQQNAVNDIEDIGTPPNVLEDNTQVSVSNTKSKSIPKSRKKKKTIVNNYHYTASIEEESSDEEIINNHYIPPKKTKSKKKPTKKRVKIVAPESESSEEEYIDDNPSLNGFTEQYNPPPKIGIRFV